METCEEASDRVRRRSFEPVFGGMQARASRKLAADGRANSTGYVNATRELAVDWRSNSTCFVNAPCRVSLSSHFTDGHGSAQANTG